MSYLAVFAFARSCSSSWSAWRWNGILASASRLLVTTAACLLRSIAERRYHRLSSRCDDAKRVIMSNHACNCPPFRALQTRELNLTLWQTHKEVGGKQIKGNGEKYSSASHTRSHSFFSACWSVGALFSLLPCYALQPGIRPPSPNGHPSHLVVVQIDLVHVLHRFDCSDERRPRMPQVLLADNVSSAREDSEEAKRGVGRSERTRSYGDLVTRGIER